MTVNDLLARTSSRELAEWEAHFALRGREQLQEGLKARAAAKLEAQPRRRR
jgi:hypothetical protein